MTERKTRAEMMAEQYGKKVEELELKESGVRIHLTSDKRTPEQQERLKKALERLRTFID